MIFVATIFVLACVIAIYFAFSSIPASLLRCLVQRHRFIRGNTNPRRHSTRSHSFAYSCSMDVALMAVTIPNRKSGKSNSLWKEFRLSKSKSSLGIQLERRLFPTLAFRL